MNNTTDIAWAAGFLDGEGCIRICRRQNGFYNLQVSIAQVVKAPLDDLQMIFGGSIRQQSGSWRWQIDSRQAAKLLEQVIPFLRVKREQAEIALQFQSRRGQRPRNRLQDEADFQAITHAKIVR